MTRTMRTDKTAQPTTDKKACPLLVQCDTHISMTVQGEGYTRSYFLTCLGTKCAAFDEESGVCLRFWQRPLEEIKNCFNCRHRSVDVMMPLRCRECENADLWDKAERED